MTAWDLLGGVCFCIAVVGALDADGLAKIGMIGYIFATAVGLFIGGCSVWLMWKVAAKAETFAARLHSESSRIWCIRGLYLSASISILGSAIVGQVVVSILLRLIFGPWKNS